MTELDYLLVGGGLQNALIAAAIAHFRPGLRIGVLEAADRLGGNHLWCFHALDVPASARPFVEPFVIRRWPGYRVQFPAFERGLAEPYAAVSSAALHEELCRLERAGRVELMLGKPARRVEPGRVELATGEELRAEVVIDARGPERFPRERALGYQKFVGLELEVSPESAPSEPTLMDATVEQVDGLRFFYVLPLEPDRVLVEDTYFSDGPELDIPSLTGEIVRYALSRGLVVRSVLRSEHGVLPLPAQASVAANANSALVHAGYQGGWFHPTTGYSFPLAVRVAETVATSAPAELSARLGELAARTTRQQRFASLLNRMLFRGLAPAQRYAAFERFYRLPAETIGRFYALTLTRADRARIVCGKPPRGMSARGLFSALTYESTPRHPHGTNP